MMTGSAFDIDLDEVTIARAKRGDMAACEIIYRKFHTPAYTVAVRVCKCRELAKDVTQEAFITAFKRMQQFRGDAPFWGWLRRVVVNHAISALRRAPRHDAVELEDHMMPMEGDQQRIGFSLDLSSALEQLDDDDRSVVWLHDVEGYKHKEIASMFGKTESFSKTRLNRARAKLRALMTENDLKTVLNATA